MHPGYEIGEDLKTTGEVEGGRVAYSHLIEVLKSTDPNLLEENSWIFEGQTKFFDQKEDSPIIDFGDFPRSGHSFTRKFIEAITGVATGNDVPFMSLDICELIFGGFKGEKVVNNKVWVVATHQPFFAALVPVEPLKSKGKHFLCVRNPLDVIVSIFHFFESRAHAVSIVFELDNPEFMEEFDRRARVFIKAWSEYHRWWVKKAKDALEKKGAPYHIIRFEDMLLEPSQTMNGLFAFFLDIPTTEGTNIQRRI